jgi:hypothetical protein
MILKVLGPYLTLGAYSRCMNVIKSACKSNVYFVESTWNAQVCLCYLKLFMLIPLYELYVCVEVGSSKIT